MEEINPYTVSEMNKRADWIIDQFLSNNNNQLTLKRLIVFELQTCQARNGGNPNNHGDN